MKSIFCKLMVAGLLVAPLAPMAIAQDTQSAKQDMKDAGDATKDAGKDVGHATAKGAKAVGHGTAKGAKKVGHATKKVFGGDKKSDKKPDSSSSASPQ